MHRQKLLAATAALLAIAACSKGDGAAGSGDTTKAPAADTSEAAGRTPPMQLPVTGENAIDGDLVISITTTGLVRSQSETRLKSEVSGVVDAILVKPGERVKKGQPLLRMSQYELDLAIRRAAVAVAAARVRYQDGYVPDSIATGKPPTAERRQNALIRSGLPDAELSLETARYDSARASLKAPFDGIVDRIDVAVGERINAGQMVTIIVDANNLRIDAAVLEHDMALVKPGGDAAVSTAAAPNKVQHGRITSVLPIVDSVSRAGRAYVVVTGTEVLRPGMYADVRLEAQRLTNRRLVPSAAIIQRDSRPLVFVVKNNRAQWTYVVPGRSNGVWTEILPDTSGQNIGQIPVAAGDVVIVQGHLTLTHDAPVRVVAKRETEARQ